LKKEKKNQKIQRSLTERSVYFFIDNEDIIISDSETNLVNKHTKFNATAIARYIVSDNLVSQSPFSTIFNEINRIQHMR
jgi:hypothetical protein